ncbi:hypothetical protein EDB19DRAFT_116423 [Suillus lakei]|nr:hypothetical protein EDB19DRAFT_116423 [Suillus lakei]
MRAEFSGTVKVLTIQALDQSGRDPGSNPSRHHDPPVDGRSQRLLHMAIFISTWCLVAAGLVFSFPMIYLRVRDTTVIWDEVKYEVSNGIQSIGRIWSSSSSWSHPVRSSSRCRRV